jgi:hypothetical protein
MSLSRFDWVLFGPGRLYGAPFVSQYLLYRLNDIDCSLLFCVESGTVSTTEVNPEARTIQTRVTARTPRVVFLHRSSSARTSLRELGQIRPFQISLESSQEKHRVDGVTVSLEPIRLPSNRGFLLLNKRAPSVAHQIEGAAYTVRMPDSLCTAPDFAKKPLNGIFFECYRVSIVNEQTGKCYDFDSDQEWSLSALGMVIDWKPVYEGILQRGS